MSSIRLIFNFIQYLIRSGNEHSVHSPFVFDLYTQVICSKTPAPAYAKVENTRSGLLADSREIRVLDLGTGAGSASTARQIRDIAARSQKSPKYGQLLYRLSHFFNPSTIFDLGTSLGTTTAYLAMGAPQATVQTFEGCPETARLAGENFAALGLPHIARHVGNIDDTLPAALAGIDRLDLVFFDANHRYAPTLSYFRQCLQKAHEGSVFIFDDIYWSDEMKMAWKEIQAHPQVTLTIDLFFIGLVFFRTRQPRQHFTLRF